MNRTLRVLMVEDSADDAEMLLWTLQRGGYTTQHVQVENAAAMSAALDAGPWDLVITDYSLPQFSGIAALELFKSRNLDIPFIIVSGHIGEDEAVAAMKGGAHDYVMKRNLSRLIPAIDRELRDAATRAARREAEARLREQEVRLTAILSNIPGVVFQLERHSDGKLRFTYVSGGSETLLGLSPEQLIANARNFTRLIVPEDAAALAAWFGEAGVMRVAAPWEGRIRLSPDSKARWISLRYSPTTAAGGAVRGAGLITDITESKLAEQEIRESRRRLSELSSHLENVKEQERGRIAREIHDVIGGNLTAVKIDLLWLAGKAETAAPLLMPKIRQLDSLVDETIATTSRIGRDLRPGILDLGLVAAIEWLASEFERRMDIPCRVACERDDLEIDADVANAMFNIFRETLTNITKHAQATRVDIRLQTDGDLLQLQVEDNGRGIAGTDLGKPGSFGLRGMEERAGQLGGSVRVSSTPGNGTCITVLLPLGGTTSADDTAGADAA